MKSRLTVSKDPKPAESPSPRFRLALLSLLSSNGCPRMGGSSPSGVRIWFSALYGGVYRRERQQLSVCEPAWELCTGLQRRHSQHSTGSATSTSPANIFYHHQPEMKTTSRWVTHPACEGRRGHNLMTFETWTMSHIHLRRYLAESQQQHGYRE